MAEVKPEEMVHHPPMDQLQGFEYCIDSNPSWGEAIALAFQHYILSLGTAVMIPTMLVPLMGGNDVSILFFSPLGMVPVVALVGLGLFERGFPVNRSQLTEDIISQVGKCVEIGLPMLILFVAFSQYLKHVHVRNAPVLERFSLLLCIALVWVYAHILTASGAYKHTALVTQINCRTDRANLISSALWISIPFPLQWGAPTFSADHAFGMMAAVLVSLIEGIGTLLDGLFGTGTGSTVSIENVGLLGSTRVGSRRVIQISAGFMIFFSMLGKFGALFASIPFTIFAAVYCVMFGIVAAVGLSFMQFTNMNSMRNLFIIGVSLFLGLSIPEYFSRYSTSSQQGPAHTKAGWFNDYINTVFSSPPTVALFVAVILDNTLDVRDAARDRGMPWWSRFRTFRGDSRNEEFYTLPFNLNRFFPPS
ncbi:hypothetical protein PR202_gb22853 [Eleusine coracana subsp. coracana]|uniref:Nucleobase-ascorbate transporter 2 n=1 Tax=Eleusine coracana subsp. coracana TaxID=191504 RepID=A0AAV5FEQ5_ELECO|nr:hypothetical protein PR202_gb22853 [Eleusine coracana subsp. coracana]